MKKSSFIILVGVLALGWTALRQVDINDAERQQQMPPVSKPAPVQVKPPVERKPILQAWDYRDDDTNEIRQVRESYIRSCRGETRLWTDQMCDKTQFQLNKYDFAKEVDKLIKTVTQ